MVGTRFRITGVLGEGGMGRVYRAELCSLGKPVAIKVLRAELATDPENVHRFIREARAASLLSHPNLVSVLDFGRLDSGEPYLAMEVCNGVSLAMLLEAGPMAPPRVARLFDSIVAAVAEAHAHGVLHLDLKPENIVVETWRDGTEFPRIIDFGIAEIAGELKVTDGAVAGTPRYAAPEVLRQQPPDSRTDLYAVGVMLYECLAGHPPFQGSIAELIDGHLTREPPPIELADRSEMADALGAIAMTALEKERENRYPSADTLRADILKAMRLGGRRPTSPQAAMEVAPTGSIPSFSVAHGTPTAGVGASVGASLSRRKDLEQQILGALLPLRPGRRVLISGAQGMGASHALRRILGPLESASMRAVFIEPDVTGARRPLYPVVRALAELMGVLSTSPQVIATFAAEEHRLDETTIDALRSLGGLDSPLDRLPSELRFREVEARLLEAFTHVSRTGLALVVFDGVDEYDAPSQRVLGRLLRAHLRLSLCLAAAPSTPGLQASDFDLSFELPPLVADEAIALLTRAVGDRAMAEAVKLAPEARTPLYVTQAAYDLAAGDDPSSLPLGEIITRRIARLPLHERDALAAAAVWGRAGTLEGLTALLDPPPANLAISVARLSQSGFFVPSRQEGRWEFRHALVHDAVYEVLPIGQRRALHKRARDQAQRMGLVEEVVLHHAAGAAELSLDSVRFHARRGALAWRGLDRAASEAALGEAYRVARKLAANGEPTELQALVNIALALADASLSANHAPLADAILREIEPDVGGQTANEAERLRLLGRALVLRGKAEEAAATYRRALMVIARAGAREALPKIAVEAAEVVAKLQSPADALHVLEDALSAASPEHGLTPPKGALPVPQLWRLALAYATALRGLGDLATAKNAARAARMLAARGGSAHGEALSAAEVARCLEQGGAPAEIAAAFDTAIDLALRSGDRGLAATLMRERARGATQSEAEVLTDEAAGLERFLLDA
jgi:serine/threonine-protein kinase